jgi:hypothetical protein
MFNLNANVHNDSSGTIDNAVNIHARGYQTGVGGEITFLSKIWSENAFLSNGEIVNLIGVNIDEMTTGTANTNLLIGAGAPATDYSIYNGSSYDNYFASNLGIGDDSPAATLTVGSGDLFQVAGATGDITTAGDLAVNGGNINSTGTLTINSATSNALTLDSGSTGAIDIGNNANAKTITIGNSTTTTTINLTKGATGNIVLTGFNCST